MLGMWMPLAPLLPRMFMSFGRLPSCDQSTQPYLAQLTMVNTQLNWLTWVDSMFYEGYNT